MQTQINFLQAINISAQKQEKSIQRFNSLLEEIDSSNPTYLTSDDFAYYASELTDHDPNNKVWTANEIRWRMLDNQDNEDLNAFDLVGTFGYENDDIIDFF